MSKQKENRGRWLSKSAVALFVMAGCSASHDASPAPSTGGGTTGASTATNGASTATTSGPATTSTAGGSAGASDGGASGATDAGNAAKDGGAATSSAQSTKPRDPASAISGDALAGAVRANNAFAIDVYSRVVVDGAHDNVLTSPLSASLALGMAYAGAVGSTATEMASALHFGASADSIFDGQNALSQALAARAATAFATAPVGTGDPSSISNYQLHIVNSLWGQTDSTWQPPFLDVLAKSYGAGVYLEDFGQQPEPARLDINAWVSAETAKKINDLLPQGSIDSSTRFVLVNAIHLKLPWASPFEPTATTTGVFTKADGTKTATSFMNEETGFLYLDDGQAQIASLPLAGGELSVMIALPRGDLATYEAGLVTGSAALTPPSSGALLSLSLPKVTFTTPTFSLAKALKAMGMGQAFTATADFSGMWPHALADGTLYLSDVLQKANVSMAESGVEAAAATAVIGGTSGGIGGPKPTPIPMVVNRPYLVAIIDNPTGAILFLGHITDPTNVGGP